MKKGNFAATLFVLAGVVFIATGVISMLVADRELMPASFALGCTFLILGGAAKSFASR